MVQVGDKFAVTSKITLEVVLQVDSGGFILVGDAVSLMPSAWYNNKASIEALPEFKYWTVLGGIMQAVYAPTPVAQVQVGDRFLIKGYRSGFGEITWVYLGTIQAVNHIGPYSAPDRATLESEPWFDGWIVLGGVNVSPTSSIPAAPTPAWSTSLQVGDHFVDFAGVDMRVVAIDYSLGKIHVRAQNIGTATFDSRIDIETWSGFRHWVVVEGSNVASPGLPTPYPLPGAFAPVPNVAPVNNVNGEWTPVATTRPGSCRSCGTQPEDRVFSTFSFKFCPKCRKEVP